MLNEQDGDHEQEEEHRDRGSEPEVVPAAERRPPHLEGDDVRIVLHGPGRDRDDDVEDLEDVDQHRDEDDREDGREQRDGHAPEDLPLGGPVHARRLEQVARDRSETGRDHHHREARPDPDVGDHDRGRDEALAEPGHATYG